LISAPSSKRRILRIFPVFYAFLFAVLELTLWTHRDFTAAEWWQAGTLYRWLNLRPMAAIGVISYGLYLWQQLILYPAAYPDGDLWWRAFPQNLVIVFMVAWLSYRWIERPFLRLKRKFTVAQ
jgi:peptidoglycan/LPS O-acetylase OafA/YrhL